MKSIILPTDFSENSINAIRYALHLFKDYKCTFYLLHTFTPTAYHSGKAFHNFTALELVHATRDVAVEKIKELRDTLKTEFKNPKHRLKWVVDFNLLISKIRSLVKEKNIDLIIMGTQGATGAREIFLGTQTMYTIKKVNRPVLAVPSGYVYKKPEEVLFATDYKILREEELLFLEFFTRLHSSRLHVLNVYTENLDEQQRANRKRLSEFLKDKKAVFHITEGKDIPEAIENFQKENNIDLIIMVHKKHGFFENILFKPVINKLVYHTNTPFMVIPVREKKDGEENYNRIQNE
ncbi:universal stress protein [Christiangramia echinicola]|uniref:universal stress protein n=1 Tax=Christiangramia echinicola TaxID=279359 RepID=UPI00040886F1|nr:universal stress protein [Christiangramia echinicola]